MVYNMTTEKMRKTAKKRLLLLFVVFLFPLAAFSQYKGELKRTDDYHYKLYLMGSQYAEGNCNIQFYSNAIVINYYKIGSNRNTISSSETYLIGPYNVYIKVKENTNEYDPSNYNSLQLDNYSSFSVYNNQPGNMFFGKTLSSTFTIGVNNIEYNSLESSSTSGNATYTPSYNGGSNNYNNSNSTQGRDKCRACLGDGKCSGYHMGMDHKYYCKGSGKCVNCYGKGWTYSSYGTGTVTCGFCNGTGKCAKCSGTGTCQKCGGSGYE